MKKILAAGAVALAGALALSACTPPATNPTTPGSSGSKGGAVDPNSAISVMWNQPFFTYNNASSYGNATANTNIIYMSNDAVTYYDKGLNVVQNKSFGTYTKVSDDPLTVKVTLADTATWSDGTPVTAEDILLAYGAQSTLFNTLTDDDAEKLKDKESGEIGATGDGQVYFDSSSESLKLITDFPKFSSNGREFTYTYSKKYADWEKVILSPGLPAHIIAKRALGISDPKAGKDAVAKAFQTKDASALSKISNSWNRDWNYVEMPADKDLVVGSGPYIISDFKKEQYLTLSLNPNYKGERKPSIGKVTIRFNEDPMAAVQALQNREVQIISPQATADVLKAVQGIQGVKSETGDEGTYEHIDLKQNNKGPFDPATYGGDAAKAKAVRQAFLTTIPRQAIVDKIIKPLNPKAEIRQSFNVVPGSPNYADVVKANGLTTQYPVQGDPEKAKKILADAGITTPVTVRFMYAAKNSRREQEFQLIKEQAEKAGFQMVGDPNPDWGKLLSTSNNYDAALFGWQSTSTAVTEAKANFVKGGQNNYYGYDNPKVDELYAQLDTETDAAKQKKINEDIEKILVDDAFGTTIFQFPGVEAWADNVSGVSKIPLSPTIFWNFWEWKLS